MYVVCMMFLQPQIPHTNGRSVGLTEGARETAAQPTVNLNPTLIAFDSDSEGDEGQPVQQTTCHQTYTT